MMGWANLPTPLPTYANASRIFCYTQPWLSSPGWPVNPANPGGGTWIPAVDPTHSEPGAGVSPLIAMADRYITLKGDPTLEVGIVPCGWAGATMNWNATSYAEWDSIYHNEQAFPAMAARAMAAAAWGPVVGLLWSQGESEAGPAYAYQPDILPNWLRGMFRIVRDTRYITNNRNLGVVVTRLGSVPNTPPNLPANFPNWVNMQGTMDQLQGCDPLLTVVTPADNSTVDGVHRTCAAQITLGQQCAAAFTAMGI